MIADSVNPIALTRDAWAEVARGNDARLVEVELVCSNTAEHRRRVEERVADIDNLELPTWKEVVGRDYEPWSRARLVLDTAQLSPADASSLIITTWRSG